MSIALDPGYTLLLGDCGGKVLFHPPDARPPDTYHLRLAFEDGSALTVTTAMWGAMELHEAGAEEDRAYIRGCGRRRWTPSSRSSTSTR